MRFVQVEAVGAKQDRILVLLELPSQCFVVLLSTGNRSVVLHVRHSSVSIHLKNMFYFYGSGLMEPASDGQSQRRERAAD